MLPRQSLRQVLATLTRTPLRGPWYRAVNFDYLAGPPPGAAPGSPLQPLWPGGAARRGARFTPQAVAAGPGGAGSPGIDCLYLAEDELTPLLEVTGVLRPPGSSVPLLFEPQGMMTVDGVLTDILDLMDIPTQTALGTTYQELTGLWLIQQAAYRAGQGPMPPTQVLGEEAFGVGGIVGMRHPSSKSPQGVGVVVFTARLVAGQQRLRVFNQPAGKLQQSLP
jgi:RES domain